MRLQSSPEAPVEEHHIHFIYAPVVDALGRVTGIFTQGHDVTEAHRTRERLRDSEAELRDLNADLERQVTERTRQLTRTWDVGPDLMGILNADGYFEHSNPAWHAVLGWSQDEIRRMQTLHLIHPDDVEASRAAFDRLKAGQTVKKFENRYRCKSGEFRWLCWVAAPEDGKIYCSGRDVTEDKARAAAMRSVEDQLRQAQKMEAVGRVTGGIAHDFNNMLAGMMSGLNIVQRRVAAGKYDDLDRIFDAVHQSGERAASLVMRLTTFSRQQVLRVEALDANALVLGMEDLLRRTIGTNIDLSVTLQPDGWAVAADAAQLESALLNLAINARDAMPDGGALTITTTNVVHGAGDRLPADLAFGDYVAFCVGDTGSGMPQDVVASGVGLGTRITRYLPAAAAPVAAVVEPGLGRPPARQTGQTVLVVDDEPLVRMMVTEILGDLAFDWTDAVDAESALSILRTDRRIDLLLTDIGLPGMNGRHLVDAARQLRPDLKVLFVTGHAGAAAPDVKALGKDFDLIAKPFDIDALGEKVIRMTVDAPPAAASTPIAAVSGGA